MTVLGPTVSQRSSADGFACVQTVVLDGCAVVWMGPAPADGGASRAPFEGLSLAMPPQRMGQMGVSSRLMGADIEDSSEVIAKRIARRTGMQVFVSNNITGPETQLIAANAEKLAVEMILEQTKK